MAKLKLQHLCASPWGGAVLCCAVDESHSMNSSLEPRATLGDIPFVS